MSNATNPWMPGYTCPFSLIGLTPGMTVNVALKTGNVTSGVLVAIARDAIAIDSNGTRCYAQMHAVDFVTWTS